jgi:hypothetical protein
VASPTTVVALVATVVVTPLRSGLLGTSSCIALSATTRLGRSVWLHLPTLASVRGLPLLSPDVALAVLSGVVELATVRERLANHLFVVNSLEPSCSSIVNLEMSIIVAILSCKYFGEQRRNFATTPSSVIS